MLILLHVLIAITNLLVSFSLWFKPSAARIQASLYLLGGTLISGSYLIWSTHSSILSGCVSGLVFVSATAVSVLVGHRKLARDN